MRFATYMHGGVEWAGVVIEDRVRPLPDRVKVRELVERGGEAIREAGEVAQRAGRDGRPAVPLADVRLLPPLEPASIRDFVAFEAHIEGVARAQEGLAAVPPAWYEAPAFYFTNPHAAVGAYDPVPVFPGSTDFDFECEVGAVIGRAGRDLTPDAAREYIAGYTIFNDWSARDLQRQEARLPFGFAKGKDGAHTLGPWLVTADELEPYRLGDGYLDLTMTAELNGQVIGKDSLASMAWPFEELVAYASRGAWVMPGDLIGSGTCGRGCLAEIRGREGSGQAPPLRPGDVVTLTVEGIGTVSNTVAPAAEPVPLPAARQRGRGVRH
jgi:2-keto-4-pentenoate hydratase/2-oxohepta-3-ene-1,7-dioic acid hydratase in catechol pathway